MSVNNNNYDNRGNEAKNEKGFAAVSTADDGLLAGNSHNSFCNDGRANSGQSLTRDAMVELAFTGPFDRLSFHDQQLVEFVSAVRRDAANMRDENLVHAAGLVFKGQMGDASTGVLVMFEHAAYPGMTATLFETDITGRDSLRAKMLSKLTEFGVAIPQDLR